MKELVEYIFESEHRVGEHGIFEMAQVSHKDDQLPKNSEVWVYGENDEQGTKPPHFHLKVDNKLEFEIKFDDLESFKIWRSKTNKKDWNNYADVKKAIKKWLKQQNKELPLYTNKRVLLTEWNRQNPNNKIDPDKYGE